ncbi:MAG TPA: PEGA domain-containing protein [Methanoregulaceae archaeon]|nr:PEGA domain-containing protein [Methanoregulaceae archaeon]HQJ87706.1 PEGA domain-containing protein [Methanoregulaceae archaeon]
MRTPLYLLCIGLLLACLASPALAETPIGGSVGAFNVRCSVEGATVWFDGKEMGKITNGLLMVPVYATGTPYQTYRVEADGYEPFLGMIQSYPSGGQIVELEVNLVKSPIGGQTGTYQFTCNVEGAYVFMDGAFQGVIENGALSVPVYTTGTPFKRYSVQASGYLSANGAIPRAPGPNEIVPIQVNLVPRETPTPIGGDRGAYLIYCQVEGAMVSLDADSAGTIQNGELFVPVYVTGTPYRTLKVTASGYKPYSAPINRYPGKGEIVHLYVFLEPLPPATTAPLIGGDMGAYLVHSNAEGASVYFDGELKGQITNGVLNVPVYVTGTPYRTWSVVKDGYATFNGTISTYPAKGETIDLQATLTLLPTTAPTTAATTTAKSPLSVAGVAGALAGLALLGFAARRR